MNNIAPACTVSLVHSCSSSDSVALDFRSVPYTEHGKVRMKEKWGGGSLFCGVVGSRTDLEIETGLP